VSGLQPRAKRGGNRDVFSLTRSREAAKERNSPLPLRERGGGEGVSGVRYQMSGIRYQVSGIRCQISDVRKPPPCPLFKGGGRRRRTGVCFSRGTEKNGARAGRPRSVTHLQVQAALRAVGRLPDGASLIRATRFRVRPTRWGSQAHPNLYMLAAPSREATPGWRFAYPGYTLSRETDPLGFAGSPQPMPYALACWGSQAHPNLCPTRLRVGVRRLTPTYVLRACVLGFAGSPQPMPYALACWGSQAHRQPMPSDL